MERRNQQSNQQPGQDRQDAMRQGRDDLDTTTRRSAPQTGEEQSRGERHGHRPKGPERRKPKNG